VRERASSWARASSGSSGLGSGSGIAWASGGGEDSGPTFRLG
jgi:hypothetical protein